MKRLFCATLLSVAGLCCSWLPYTFSWSLRPHCARGRSLIGVERDLSHTYVKIAPLYASRRSFWHNPAEKLDIEVLHTSALQAPQQVQPKVTTKNDDDSQSKPPLLFLHGSFHSAWCWEEHYFPHFEQLGYNCYAMSMRGTKATGMPTDESESKRKSVKVEEHVRDLSFVINEIK